MKVFSLMAFSVLPALATWPTVAVYADAPVGFQQGARLLSKYHCQTCHAVDRATTGPSLRAIAKKYASDPHAPDVLGESILNGSSGVWGGPSPMPATTVPTQDLKPLVAWILSLNQF